VVDKPAGVRMHPGHPRPLASLKEMLRRELWDHPGAPAELVHRLDAGTSGLAVLALRTDAARHLAGQFEGRRVDKRYRAVVHGRMGTDAGVIDLPLGPAGPRGERRQGIGGAAARPARTRFAVLERRADRTLVELFPETGRRHQIRVHLAALGHPVVGDALYGPDGDANAAPRHALHAAGLAFTHPRTGERLRFDAPLPPGWWDGAPMAARAAVALA
jgi:tRNA pseudouridine32 synthase/23S rRNA pseudouridine746 synthase